MPLLDVSRFYVILLFKAKCKTAARSDKPITKLYLTSHNSSSVSKIKIEHIRQNAYIRILHIQQVIAFICYCAYQQGFTTYSLPCWYFQQIYSVSITSMMLCSKHLIDWARFSLCRSQIPHMLNDQNKDLYKEKYQNAFPLPVVLLQSLVPHSRCSWSI
jgi:hypothetical protein